MTPARVSGIPLVACALAAVASSGCGAPRIPIVSDTRTVVSLQSNEDDICGTFDTGEAFCGAVDLTLPYETLNARGTGRAIRVEEGCVLFESGDIWCSTASGDTGFVSRPSGARFREVVAGPA